MEHRSRTLGGVVILFAASGCATTDGRHITSAGEPPRQSLALRPLELKRRAYRFEIRAFNTIDSHRPGIDKDVSSVTAPVVIAKRSLVLLGDGGSGVQCEIVTTAIVVEKAASWTPEELEGFERFVKA